MRETELQASPNMFREEVPDIAGILGLAAITAGLLGPEKPMTDMRGQKETSSVVFEKPAYENAVALLGERSILSVLAQADSCYDPR